MLVIIPAEEHHLSDIATAERLCFSDPWPELSLKNLMLNPEIVFLVAEYDGCFAGYIIGRNIAGDVSLYNIAVCEDFRRRGIGKKLIESFISCFPSYNCILLEARESNLAARSLYENAGFRLVGVRKNYYSRPVENACLYTLFPEQRQ